MNSAVHAGTSDGPISVVEEVRSDERHFHVATFTDGLATVHAFDHGELAGFLLQQARDAVDVLGAFGRGHLAPHGVVGLAGGLHGGVHIGCIGFGDARELCSLAGLMVSK